ncbi:MAG: ABC transporter permease [Cyclobacteriaceae bacterium]
MLKHHFINACRSVKRDKITSILNVAGLSIGLASTLIIGSYVTFELSFDQYHSKADRIFRIATDFRASADELMHEASSPNALATIINDEIPQVESVVRMRRNRKTVLRYEGSKFEEPNIYIVDSTLFNVFDFEIIEGADEGLLVAPNQIVITESVAKKYFGNQSAVNKSIMYGSYPQQVQAVIKDLPKNSTFDFEILLSYPTLGQKDTWNNYNWFTYILLNSPEDIVAVDKAIEAARDSHLPDFYKPRVFFQSERLTDIHLYSGRSFELVKTSDGDTIKYLTFIGILVILLAWINYINLITAKSLERAKEVGIRRCLGSSQRSLIGKFLIESFVVNGLAFVLGLSIAQVFTNFSETLIGQSINLDSLLLSSIGFAWIAFLIIGSLVIGVYPALILSSFSPISGLKQKLSTTQKGTFLRKFLVIMQFTISLIAIMGAVIVYQQISFMRNQELGFDPNQVYVVNIPRLEAGDSLRATKVETFLNRVRAISGVTSVAATDAMPGSGDAELSSTEIGLKSDADVKMVSYYFRVDEHFIDHMDIEFVAGSNFKKGISTNDDGYQHMIINEQTVKMLGLESPESALDQTIKWFAGETKIIGVIKDYNHHSLRNEVDPFYLVMDSDISTLDYAGIRFNAEVFQSGALRDKTQEIGNIYDEMFPQAVLSPFFLDDHFDRQYQADLQFGKVFGLFTVFMIVIACLGLFGLVTFSVNQKVKEIGIRKVLGASIQQIMIVLSKDFMKIVAVAILIAMPLGYYVMNQWLSGYAFRIQIGWVLLLLPAFVLLILSLLVLSSQVIKSAMTNPVEALRCE